MDDFRDPFSDLSHLEEPSADEILKKALWMIAEESGMNDSKDVILNGVVLCVEYQHVGTTTGFEYRVITRRPGGVLPFWQARGLAETLLDYVKNVLPGQQRRANSEE